MNVSFSSDFYASSLGDGLGFIGWYDGVTGGPSTNTIQPGVGVFYFNPASSNVILTLTGTVLQGVQLSSSACWLLADFNGGAPGDHAGHHGDEQLPGG